MRICLFTSTFLPAVGGAEYVVHYLAKELVQMGHQVTVLAEGRKRKEDAAFPYIVHRYRGLKGLVSYEKVKAMHLVFEKLRTRFDLLHAHRTYPPGYVAAKLKHLLNISVVITPHGDDIQKMPEINYGIRLEPELEAKVKYALERTDAITVISESIRNDVLNLIAAPDKVHDVPNGVELDSYIGQNENAYNPRSCNLPPKGNLILAVGRNHIKKGYQYLLRAMSLVLKKYENTNLVVLGKGTESLLPLIRDLGIGRHVVLPGVIGQRNLPSFYNRADLFVMPSLIESFGLVTLEAMAAGLPIVATNIPGSRDLVADGVNGFLVPPKSPESLAEKIILLVKNKKLRKEMGQESYQMARRYDWKIITKKYVEVYETVLHK